MKQSMMRRGLSRLSRCLSIQQGMGITSPKSEACDMRDSSDLRFARPSQSGELSLFENVWCRSEVQSEPLVSYLVAQSALPSALKGQLKRDRSSCRQSLELMLWAEISRHSTTNQCFLGSRAACRISKVSMARRLGKRAVRILCESSDAS